MPDPSTIALVSVIVAGTTAIATPLSNSWYDARKESRRFRREMYARDVAELLALLDDAASAFDEAFSARAELTKLWMLQPLDNCSDLIDEVQAKRNRLVVLKARLGTRLGRQHAVTCAYDEAIDRFDEAVHALVSAHVTAKLEGGLDARPTDKKRADATATIRPKIAQMNAAMNRFSDEAQKLAGFHMAR